MPLVKRLFYFNSVLFPYKYIFILIEISKLFKFLIFLTLKIYYFKFGVKTKKSDLRYPHACRQIIQFPQEKRTRDTLT